MAGATDMQRQDGDGLFLPDFCNVRTVFAVVVIAQLLAFVIALAPLDRPAGRWDQLAMVSLFVQWVALSGTAMLCLTRPLLRRLGSVAAGLVSYGLLLALVLLVSEGAFQLVIKGVVLGADAHRDFLLRNLAIGAIVSGFALHYLYIQHQWRRRVQAESTARLEALQARIRPHFLFNSMNTIASLTRTAPRLAERAVEDLADLFRVSLADPRQQRPLAEELELTRRYLQIEQLRLGERLGVQWDVDALPADALLPPLTLQPLVENAVYHGIEPRGEGGTLHIAGRRDGGAIEILLTNPLGTDAARPAQGHRMALDNIRERLAAHYGAAGALEVEAGASDYRVRLRFPYRREADEDPDRR